jgi:hypothetical protein
VRSLAALPVAAAMTTGACSLFVETEDLQSGASGPGGGSMSSATATTTAASATTSSSASSGESASSSGGDGGADGGGGAASQGGAGGAGGSWCDRNAPDDAFLCVDFDVEGKAVNNPPWSNAEFEDSNGSITLDAERNTSPPYSARVVIDVPDATCDYQALQRTLTGTPDRIQIAFDMFAPEPGDGALLATVDWETGAEVPCKLILSLNHTYGFLFEQHSAVSHAEDQFQLATTPFGGWRAIVWSLDIGAGLAGLAIDGKPVYFADNEGTTMALSPECTGAVTVGSVQIRLGPHCEQAPLEVSFDNVVIAPLP